MAKSIIDVEVNDEAFKRFHELFTQYQDHLEKMPEDWKKIDEAMNGSGKQFRDASGQTKEALAIAATSAGLIVSAIEKATKAQKDLGSATRQSGNSMSRLATETGKVSKSIFGMAKYLFKIGSLGAGLAGIASGFGLNALAESVLNSRYNARGMGLSVGQMKSFEINMRPYVGSGVLQGAAQAQVNPAQYGNLAVLGINPQTAQRESASNLAIREINAVRKAWQANPSAYNPQVMAAQRLGFTMSDIRNVGTAGPGLFQHERMVGRDASGLGYTNAVAREWADLATKMHKAGVVIESALIRGLAGLTPQLGQLSHELAALITSMLKSKTFKLFISQFVSGLKDAVTFMASPQFKKDLQTFGEAVYKTSQVILAVADKLGWIVGTNKGTASMPHTSPVSVPKGFMAGWRKRHPVSPRSTMQSQVNAAVIPYSEADKWEGNYLNPVHSYRDSELASLIKMLSKQQMAKSTHVTISNRTSARVSVSANAVAP